MAGLARADALERLGAQQFDVLVIGGGITGAGVALDAASRGLRTALVERSDFAAGTSSKSSKMVHGGIRYLQQREFRLVYENLAERQRLLKNAPHLVSPLPFLIPLFGTGGVVQKTVARSYSVALWTYDLTGGLRIGERHRRIGRDEALAHLPSLRVDRLVAGFLYYDARADDARLTLSLVRTAALDYGAVVANYTPVVGLVHAGRGGRLEGAVVHPEGAAPFEVRARAVVNATGVWAGQVAGLDESDSAPALRPAKGVHASVPAARMPADIAAVIPVPGDHRSIFVVPWPEGDFVYLGTTDTEYDGPLDDPTCSAEDIEYLLGAVNAVTDARLTPADVTGVWAGLRPLLAPEPGAHSLSERTADLSRRHTVRSSPKGLVTVTGGKLTTYRKMAEDAVDRVLEVLQEPSRRSPTARLALRGAGAPPTDPALEALPPAHQAHLRARYGSEAAEVLRLGDGPGPLEPLVDGLPYLRAEARYAVVHEMALHLDDVLARRTRALLMDGEASAAAAPGVGIEMGTLLGWGDETRQAEAQAFAATARRELAAARAPERPGVSGTR